MPDPFVASDDLHAAGAYKAGAPRLARAAAPLLNAFDRQRLRMLPPPPARLLDAGAGKGRFVLAARAAGYEASGIEPSPRAPAPHVEPVGIEEADVAPGSLDVVTLWHVAEHLDDPAAALHRIATWLAPGGTLVIGVPNLASFQARIGGPRWYHLDVPRHRVHFTAAGVHALLARTGFSVRRTHHVLVEHNPFGLWQSAVSRATPTPSWLYNALKRNAALAFPRDVLPTLSALPLIPIAVAAEAVAGAARRGGTIAVVAVKAL